MLLRFLFPSWKFFEDFQSYPRLQIRHRLEDGDWSSWEEPPTAPDRRIDHLLFNPPANFQMACNSLLEKLLMLIPNLKPDQDIEKTPAFLRVKYWARFCLKDQKFHEYQFQVLILDIPSNESQLAIMSRIYEA